MVANVIDFKDVKEFDLFKTFHYNNRIKNFAKL